MDNFLIRCATISDFPQIVKIDDEIFAPFADSPAIIRARLDVFNAGFMVAERAGDLMGYASSEKWVREHDPALNESPYVTHYDNGAIFYVKNIAVRPAYRGQGVGTALLYNLVALAKQQESASVLVECNGKAVDFYKKHGFWEIRQRRQLSRTLYTMVLSL